MEDENLLPEGSLRLDRRHAAHQEINVRWQLRRDIWADVPRLGRGKLAADYERMSAMIFGTPPSFAEVLGSINALERYLNATVAK